MWESVWTFLVTFMLSFGVCLDLLSKVGMASILWLCSVWHPVSSPLSDAPLSVPQCPYSTPFLRWEETILSYNLTCWSCGSFQDFCYWFHPCSRCFPWICLHVVGKWLNPSKKWALTLDCMFPQEVNMIIWTTNSLHTSLTPLIFTYVLKFYLLSPNGHV